tara:strand:- start:455 stop:2407 length:1953 start_codon:yes stop_codon:yes gene_type:complete
MESSNINKLLDSYKTIPRDELISKKLLINVKKDNIDETWQNSIIPLILRCLQDLSVTLRNNKKIPFNLIIKGGVVSLKYINTVEKVNDIDVLIIPKNTNKIPPGANNFIDSILQISEIYSKTSISFLINSLYGICVYMNAESLYFKENISGIKTQPGNMFRIRPYFIKKENITLIALDLVSNDQKSSINVLDVVFPSKLNDDDLILDSGLLLPSSDSFIKDLEYTIKRTSNHDKKTRRLVRLLNVKLRNEKPSDDVYQNVIDLYKPKLTYSSNKLSNYIGNTGICTLFNYTNNTIIKHSPTFFEVMYNFLATYKLSKIEHNQFVCFVNAAKIFGVKQRQCQIYLSNYKVPLTISTCNHVQSLKIQKYIDSFNLFSKLTNIGLEKKLNWVQNWEKSKVRPYLNGGKGIVYALKNKIKPTILKSYLYDTYDYDIHVSVLRKNSSELIEKCKTVFDKFIDSFIKDNRYKLLYNKFTKTNKKTNVSKSYYTLTYVLLKKYNNYDKVVFDITFTSESHLDQYNNLLLDKSSSTKHNIPIKTITSYGNDIMFQIINSYIDNTISPYKYKKLLVRAYYLQKLNLDKDNTVFDFLKDIYKLYELGTKRKLKKPFWFIHDYKDYVSTKNIKSVYLLYKKPILDLIKIIENNYKKSSYRH